MQQCDNLAMVVYLIIDAQQFLDGFKFCVLQQCEVNDQLLKCKIYRIPLNLVDFDKVSCTEHKDLPLTH